MDYWKKVRTEFDEMVNRIFETPEFQRLFAVPYTPARLRLQKDQMRHYVRGRRDCWAAVSSRAPLDVKRAIWEHEKDELIFDERMGRAHVAEQDLSPGDDSRLLPGARAALYAWLYCMRERSWLEGLAALHITERMNNGKIVRGGGFTERRARKEMADLGKSEADLDLDTRVHMVADVEHSDLFEPIFERYIRDELCARAVVDAAKDSLSIYRGFRGAIATAMLEIE